MYAPQKLRSHCLFPSYPPSLRVLATMVCVAAVALANHPGADSSPGKQDGPQPCPAEGCQSDGLLVALALPLSGAHAAVGRLVLEPVSRSLASLERVRIVQIDTGGTVTGAEKAVLEAVEAGAGLIVGGVGDREAAALSTAAGKAGIPLLTMGRSVMSGSTTVQSVVSRRRMNQELVGELLRQGPADCAWIVYMNGAFGEAERDAFAWAASSKGIKVAGSSRMRSAGDDEVAFAGAVTTAVGQFRSSGACSNEVLHLILDVPDAARLVDYLLFSGYFEKESGSVRVSGTGLFNSPGLAAQHGASLRNAVFVDVNPDVSSRSSRNDLFMAEVDDLATVSAQVAAWLAAGKGEDLSGIPVIVGRTGRLKIEDGGVIGQAIRVFRMTGRGVEVLPLPEEPGAVDAESAGDGGVGTALE